MIKKTRTNFQDLMEYKNTVFRICLGFSKNFSDAEDLTQDIYLKAYLKLGSLNNPGKKKKWLFSIAKNTCLDSIKKNRRRSKTIIPDKNEHYTKETPESLTEFKEQLKILKTTISRLPKKQHEIFILKEYAHLSYQEIASTLGIKEGTVMSRLNRARQFVITRMRRHLYGRQGNFKQN